MATGTIIDDILGIHSILTRYQHIAVVGLSANWHRPSYFAAKYLKDHGYTIYPVNPRYESVLDEPCYPQLASIPQVPEVVDLFQRVEAVLPFVDQAIEIGARVIWMQLGIVNLDAARRATDAGLDVVMNRCMKIEHARLMGGLNLVGVTTGVVSARRRKWLPH